MKVLVIGTGYVGLVTGVCFASQGNEVLCVDADEQKIARLRVSLCPIYEDGLESLMREQMLMGRLTFAATVPDNANYDLAFIAVGTPPQSDGKVELGNVFAATEELGSKLRTGAVVATKSTVPVGTGDKMQRLLMKMGRSDLRVASVPEFLREGTAVQDTLHPTRLIFGVTDSDTADVLKALHARIDAPALVCSRPTAEMIKYASNGFLATKISFINEIANICSRVNADVSQVAVGMGLDPRIGVSFLRAGLGYGGSCFPKDTSALVNIAGDVDYDFKLLKAVVEVNQQQRLAPLGQLKEWLHDLSRKRIGILGAAFKPGTDDVRESPAVELAHVLTERGATVQVYDPVVRQFRDRTGAIVHVLDDAYLTVKDADAAIIITEWPQIVDLDWPRVRLLMRRPHIYDGRNVLEPETLQSMGFVFANVGHQSAPVALRV